MKIIHDFSVNEDCSYMEFFILVGYIPSLKSLFVYRFSIAMFMGELAFFFMDCILAVVVSTLWSFIGDIEDKEHIVVVDIFGIAVDAAADSSNYCRAFEDCTLAGFALKEVEDRNHNASSGMEDKDNSCWDASVDQDKVVVDSYYCLLYYYMVDYMVAFAVMVVADLCYNCCRSYYK